MLTKRRKEILEYIKNFIKENDYSPTYEEIGQHFGRKSRSTIHEHVEALRVGGFLNKVDNQPRTIDVYENKQMIQVRLLGTIAAGKPIEAIEVPERITVPKSNLGSGEYFALRVKGNSMIDEGIFDGSIVIIKKQATAENGDTVVAVVNNDQVTLKKFYQEGNKIKLQPANPKMKPIIVDPVNLLIQGKVIYIYKKLSESEIKTKKESKKKKQGPIQKFIDDKKSNLKMIWGDAYRVLKKLKPECIDLMVTSPPYFNAREYSQWKSLESYLEDMRKIFKECFRALKNHRIFVLNVGDINCQLGRQPWTKRRVPLGALFTVMFREIGFEYVDDFIWDKGEPQSYRHKNGGLNYPMYQYPINCYEHILIFHKHRLDPVRVHCPVCNSKHIQNNSQTEPYVQSWECNNEKCPQRSAGNRGKRFSTRSIMMQNGQKKKNEINEEFISKWRRDIIKFSPVIKIGLNGENKLGHTAPFPVDIPKMAIRYYSYIGDKVLDPFSGSFTTGITAVKLKRIGIGIDINKKLFQKSVKERVNKEFGHSSFQQNLELFKNDKLKPSYKEINLLRK